MSRLDLWINRSLNYLAEFPLLTDLVLGLLFTGVALALTYYLREKRGMRLRYLLLCLAVLLGLGLMLAYCLGTGVSAIFAGMGASCCPYLLNQLNRGEWRY